MDRLELFKNLIILAAADGKFTEQEVAFLTVRAEDWKIPHSEVEAALAIADDPDAEITLPEAPAARQELLREMIYLMAVDGVLAEIEKGLCAAASAAMGFTTAEFNQIVDSLLSER